MKFQHYLGYSASSFITHTLSAVPGRPYSAPAVLTHPRQSLPIPGRHYPCPAVFYGPPRNSGRPATSPAVRISRHDHLCLTLLRMA